MKTELWGIHLTAGQKDGYYSICDWTECAMISQNCIFLLCFFISVGIQILKPFILQITCFSSLFL